MLREKPISTARKARDLISRRYETLAALEGITFPKIKFIRLWGQRVQSRLKFKPLAISLPKEQEKKSLREVQLF